MIFDRKIIDIKSLKTSSSKFLEAFPFMIVAPKTSPFTTHCLSSNAVFLLLIREPALKIKFVAFPKQVAITLALTINCGYINIL